MKISVCFLLLFTSLLSFQPNMVFAEVVLDQGQTDGGTNAPFILGLENPAYQTFRAGYTGELDRVEIMIRNNSLADWAEEGLARILSHPDGEEIGRQVFPIPRLQDFYSNYPDIYFTERPQLIEGNVYRIELSPLTGRFSWVYHQFNSYADGESSIHAGYDFLFKTYMLLDTEPPVIALNPQSAQPTAGDVEINVAVTDRSRIESVKWAEGQLEIGDFQSIGTDITFGRSFTVEENGWYTVYAKDAGHYGNEAVETIQITNIYKQTPQKPLVTTGPQIVNTNSMVVSGTAEARTEVRITGGLTSSQEQVSATGEFSIEVPLLQNSLNSLQIVSRNPAGLESEAETLTIIHSNQKPIIQLQGETHVPHIQGAEYVDAGAIVESSVYGETGEPTVNNLVETTIPGVYPVHYTYTNGAGYEADSVTRWVTVEPAVTISLQGESEITISQNEEYAEPGYTAESYYDGDLTALVNVTGKVDTTTVGTYELVYKASDSRGFDAEEQKRLVHVVEVKKPNLPPSGPEAPINGDTVTPNTPKPAPNSANTMLKELRLVAGTQKLALSPRFDPNTFHYTAYTSAATLTLQLETENQKARIKIGDEFLDFPQTLPIEVGKNEWEITIQAEQGTAKTYHLVVFRDTGDTASSKWMDIRGHWGESAILEANAQGWLSGYPDGIFQPNDSVSRAEFVRILVQALKLDMGEHFAANADTKLDGLSAEDRKASSQEDLEALSAAVNHGLIQGDREGRLHPRGNLTRAEMTMILYRLYREKEQPVRAVQYGDARSIPEWAKESVRTISALGIVQGRSNGHFSPYDLTTKAEAVTVIHRLLKAGQEPINEQIK
ncbi:immunoglobulin-like domain-containing protein [Bacillus horti]|uniref:immunoglobulin-like domain-containing protein n=1 Tax=Caldalkalibacillus horti TaxID=77523 RepID=UPI0027D894E8|nr:immunoglobulin-like domain-containing protein [Bacillus horti]